MRDTEQSELAEHVTAAKFSDHGIAGLVDHLQAVHDALESEQGVTIPSRVIHMPLAFDDGETRAAVSARRIVSGLVHSNDDGTALRISKGNDLTKQVVAGADSWQDRMGCGP